MVTKRKNAFLGEVFAGNTMVKTMKLLAFLFFFVGIIFSTAAIATTREDFGYRGFLAYSGVGLLAGALIFELAEIIRWLQKIFERFDLYDKIDR